MMESVAAVKGSIFASVADDVRRARAEGCLGDDDFEAMLDDKDRALLGELVTAVSWMPMATYGRMLELLACVEGAGRREAYLRERGARAAERLLAGTYQSFDNGTPWGQRAGEMMVGIAGVLYSFSRWSFRETAAGAWEISACEALEFPEAAAHTAHGFLNWFANRASEVAIETVLDRPAPDRWVWELRARG